MEHENNSTEFKAPRHWVGHEELDPAYWSDAKILEKRGQEFHDKPIETIALIDRLDQQGLARRDFLTIMSASMAMAGLSCARRPVNKIIPYVVQPEFLTPGVANHFATTNPETGMGMLVKTREGRPIKLEGNEKHPLNNGKLSAREQGSLLDLYDQDRLKGPRGRKKGGTSSTMKWDELDRAVQGQLKAAKGVRVLTGTLVSDTQRKLISEFAGGSQNHIEFDLMALTEIAQGQELSYGNRVIPTYRFQDAEMIVSFGADFLGTWPNSVENAANFAKTRKLTGANSKMSKLVMFESIFSLTGANADERFPVRPGDEYRIALAIANELRPVAGFESIDAQVVGRETGIDPGMITSVAHALKTHGSKALVLAGGVSTRTKDSLALQIVVNHINSLLGAEGVTVDGVEQCDARPFHGIDKVEALVSDMNAGKVDLLVIYKSNPLFTFPKSLKFEEALKKVAMVVYAGDREDETGLVADFVAPDHHYLENWGDAHIRKHVYSLQQPVIAPLNQTRAFEDSLLTWSGKNTTWHDYLKNSWREGVYKLAGAGRDFETFWESSLRDGVIDLGSSKRGGSRQFKPTSLNQLGKPGVVSGVGFALYASSITYDGRSLNNPWLAELPDPVSTATWDNHLSVGVKAAETMGLQNDDVVSITASGVTFELPVFIQTGMHPSSVAAQVGFGRRAAGHVGNGMGVDLFGVSAINNGQVVMSGFPVTVTKTGKYYQLAKTQWHYAAQERPIINDITLAEYKVNPAKAMETNPELKMEDVPTIWPVHEYKGYRWGMTIDLNACTGCNACMIACQAENNIPVVGRKNVRVSRQMHWIRLDRYFSGDPERPDVLFQPMLCQHCENAPCETVCPVLATVHDDEGTSNQAYNRCVGTRYCQNNCPYKVRRFNFFDHWKDYEGTMNLVWNPDVTVRTRGIMEKCSFCIQRINEGKSAAKDHKTKVQDGDIKTACQQTCPTDAITFGDMNNKETRISKLKEDPRAFRALEVLNTKPSISYLAKVRNKDHKTSHEGGHA